MCCQVVTYDMMAAAVSTLAASIDPWQPAGLPSLKLAVGHCVVSFGALNLHINQKGSGVKQMQRRFSLSGK